MKKFKGYSSVMLLSGILLTSLFFGKDAHSATLKTDVVVSSNIITVGDIFDNAGAQASAIVTAAPPPGRPLVLDVMSLISVAKSNGLAWLPESDADHATITRAGDRFAADQISEALAQTLPPQAVSASGTTKVRLDNAAIELYAPTEEMASLDILNSSYDPSSKKVSAIVRLVNGQKILSEQSVSGRVITTTSLPVLTRAMHNEDVISATDIDWQDLEVSAGTENFLYRAEDVIGKTPRRAVRAGVPLRTIDLVSPVAIKKGQTVTMMFVDGRLQITARGRALMDGAVGDNIRVVNLTSSRTIEGTIEKEGVVRVGPESTALTSAMR